MAKEKTSKAVSQPIYRHGEGYIVEVVVNPTGNDSAVSGIDLGSMPVPDRRFSCDAASVLVESHMVKLLFVQRHPVGLGMLSMLVINMAFEAVLQFNATIDEDFEKNVALLGNTVGRDGLSTFDGKADQTVILNASMVLAGYSGGDGCIDFFYSSPFAVRQVAFFKKMAIEPIVRVNLPTGVLLDMLDKLKAISSTLPSVLRK